MDEPREVKEHTPEDVSKAKFHKPGTRIRVKTADGFAIYELQGKGWVLIELVKGET